ncbi:MAG: FAD-binding and (Fe-S)-binding domain-containing protein [Acidimicrobiales bacterium]|jgi:D-lactate dehydrogenase
MTTTVIVTRLCEVLPESRVDTTAITLTVNARDGGFYEYRPKAVVRVANEEEVRALLGAARDLRLPVTFRAGGTSLAGQAVGEGIIADCSHGFTGIEVLDSGARVRCEPGPTAEMVNRVLRPYGRRIGPDPASIRAARIGGIIANNSSGMITGVKLNAYHTMNSIRFVLADGSVWDTAIGNEHERFARERPDLAQGLVELRDEVRTDADLVTLISKKFSIKCVTGYGINALVDFDDPLAILAHLLVGSEGTLGFISHVVLGTVPLDPERSAALLLFESLETMANAIPTVEATGPNAVEFLDDASMQAVSGIDGLPDLVRTHPKGSAALLVDYQRTTQDALKTAVAAALPKLKALPGLIVMSDFSTTPASHARLWRVREDLFGIVGGSRTPGTTVLLEDMAVPLDEFAKLLTGLEALFAKHGYTQPGQGVQFGHASAGNAHFVLTADFTQQREIDRFMAFTEDSVILVADQLNGSLKAEHGTGRAMAPFVSREWGDKAYSLMKRIKKVVDPENLFNPGVLINDDPDVVSRNIKRTPPVSPLIDKCIECGFCEHVCPSRLVTLTPRGRIQVSRKHVELLAKGDDSAAAELWRQYQYAGINTCAADGMCGTECPVGINVAEYSAELRAERNNKAETAFGSLLARRYAEVEKFARGGLAMGVLANKAHAMEALTKGVHKLIPFSPVWSPAIGSSPTPVFRTENAPEVVYFPACVTRIMGSSNLAKPSVTATVLTLADRAGIKVRLPKSVAGVCCGQIWEHRGYAAGQRYMANHLVDSMWKWTDGGRLRVMCDVTSCTKTILRDITDQLTEENVKRHRKMTVVDIAPWLLEDVLPRLEVTRPKRSVALHPTCACVELGVDKHVQAIGEVCAREAVTPAHWGCCGTAGDRGFMYPELSDGAQRDEHAELAGRDFDGYYSLARTCEIGLSQRSGHEYESIVYLVEEATRGSGTTNKAR